MVFPNFSGAAQSCSELLRAAQSCSELLRLLVFYVVSCSSPSVLESAIVYRGSLCVYSGPHICGHPHQRPPLLKGHNFRGHTCIIVCIIPLMRGHPSPLKRPQGYPYKRGTTASCCLMPERPRLKNRFIDGVLDAFLVYRVIDNYMSLNMTTLILMSSIFNRFSIHVHSVLSLG